MLVGTLLLGAAFFFFYHQNSDPYGVGHPLNTVPGTPAAPFELKPPLHNIPDLDLWHEPEPETKEQGEEPYERPSRPSGKEETGPRGQWIRGSSAKSITTPIADQ